MCGFVLGMVPVALLIRSVLQGCTVIPRARAVALVNVVHMARGECVIRAWCAMLGSASCPRMKARSALARSRSLILPAELVWSAVWKRTNVFDGFLRKRVRNAGAFITVVSTLRPNAYINSRTVLSPYRTRPLLQ